MPSGGLVEAVRPGGSGARAGVRTGDRLLALDGQPVRDVLDVQWLEADGVNEVTVRRGRRTLRLATGGGDLGLIFASSLFDGVMTCRNRCVFCFVDQLPAGLRESLYVKDDDFRLSLMYGNFITLTNLRDEDVRRIEEQHLSPLYVSWHASDERVRARLFGGRDGGRARARLEALLASGIELHVQIVLCPGLNDEEVLEDTLTDLFAHGPLVRSVGVVPVRRSAVGRRDDRPPVPGPAGVRRALAAIGRWQRRAMIERGSRWVWPADELLLKTGRRLPGVSTYEDFPQLGNGVGTAARFLSGLARGLRVGRCGLHRPLTALTGVLALPVMESAADIVDARRRIRMEVRAVPNVLFGGDVTVTGLLGGRELAGAIAATDQDHLVLVPDVAFEPGGRTLDGLSLTELEAEAPGRVLLAPTEGRAFAGFIRDLCEAKGRPA